MSQVKRAPLADQAADLLLERIRAGEWSLGAKLPGETTLGPQLGVGRSTVREAIRQLAGRGVLASRQGAGVFVTALDATEDWDVVLRRTDIVSVIEARIAIESEAAALAAERRTPPDLRAIRRALAQREGHAELEGYVDADMRFHRVVVAAAHNPILLDLFDSFVPRLREAMIEMLRINPPQGDDTDHGAHAQLVEAIAEHDVLAAEQSSREHLEQLKRGLQQPRGRG